MWRPEFHLACWIVAISSSTFAVEQELPTVQLGQARREPVAALFWNDELAVIACAKSGSLIFWDLSAARITYEFAVGKQLRGMARWANDQLLVIDDKSHELVQLRYADGQLIELHRYAVPAYPVSIQTFEVQGVKQAAIASLWSRRVTLWQFGRAANSNHELQLVRTHSLDFEPRAIAGGATTLLVADAFGGQLTMIDLKTGEQSAGQVLPRDKGWAAHNLGGLAWDQAAQHWWISYLTSQSNRPVTAENLQQQQLIVSKLEQLGKHRWSAKLEDAALPAADPAGILSTPTAALVCLAGSNEVVVIDRDCRMTKRITVGRRPRAIVGNGKKAIVLGELDDSLTVINLEQFSSNLRRLSTRHLTPSERGERLFFDARLSASGRMSCHSCHPDGHTDGLLADTLGDNTHGTPKRVLTLRGTRLTDLWAWNGEMKTLQDSVHKSLRETMHAPLIKPADVDDLVSFLHTLPPVPPLRQALQGDADRAQVARGEQVFLREKCDRCHVPPLTFTSHDVYDVGMTDELGLKKFNPPSLRGVGRLKRLFHDNRAVSLRDVFETYGHQLNDPLLEAELADLIRYLESL